MDVEDGSGECQARHRHHSECQEHHRHHSECQDRRPPHHDDERDDQGESPAEPHAKRMSLQPPPHEHTPLLTATDNLAASRRKYSQHDDKRIILNVGGIRHETRVATLNNFPNTRLSRLAVSHVSTPHKREYFFDRHPTVFNSIIDFYRTGELHVPLDVCGAVVKRELDFWLIDELLIRSCCWRHYRLYIDTQRILEAYNTNIGDEFEDYNLTGLEGWKLFQMQVWFVLDKPRTSRLALVYGIVSFMFVLTSIMGFVLESLPDLRQSASNGTDARADCVDDKDIAFVNLLPVRSLTYVDMVCTAFFTFELIARFIFAPYKLRFIRSPMNIIDLLALIPLYVQTILDHSEYPICYTNERLIFEVMFMLRIIRMFRVFHLVKHYQALKILVCALKASVQELWMLTIFLVIGMLVFSTMIYYAERKDVATPSKSFSTIPKGFWWAIITMTTVGYGDVFPTSTLGYCVGSACALSGVLLVALTIPVISNNFFLFYTHVRSRSDKMRSKTNNNMDDYEVAVEMKRSASRKFSITSQLLDDYINGKANKESCSRNKSDEPEITYIEMVKKRELISHDSSDSLRGWTQDTGVYSEVRSSDNDMI